ncbi:MAG: hypothetical protein DWQ39_07350 [Bacteroidetes bacterium]|mgnify:CR=1 FL=1|nr:MAG: hypothetical protein DWQ33_00370 [Bacteroidota bacterium]REK05019.1 MAG: hypothetical protein DWQ39_07350 [Bacteroidota bacterium]REK51692.1 MAG: hypothetical protein DWQ48_00650 [Bacteroidota bacterium]
MKSYSQESINFLIEVIRSEDEYSRQWLAASSDPELLEFWDAYDGDTRKFNTLMHSEHKELAASLDALMGNDNAKVWLIKSGNRDMAAFVDACSGNKTAVALLLRLKQKSWLKLAFEIHQHDKKKEKKSFWSFLNFGNPFR